MAGLWENIHKFKGPVCLQVLKTVKLFFILKNKEDTENRFG